MTTNPSGGFELDLPEGEYEVYISPPEELGLGSVTIDRVSITQKSPRIDYRYTGIRVQGTVLAPSGAFVDSGHVSVYVPDEFYVFQTLKNGAFSVLVARSGTYRITAYSLDPSMPSSASQTLALTVDTTLAIQIEGDLVSGTLFGPDGAGLEGATIRAEGFYSYAEAKAGGTYQFWVRPGGYRFRIAPPDDMRFILPRITSFRTISGPTNVDASLAGTRWSGLVRWATDSSVVTSARISAAVVADYYNRSAVDTTSNDGAFELILEPGKEYDLSIYSTAQAKPLVIGGLIAGADSTFNIYVPSPAP